MKVVTVLGARPQFIKAGTVSRAISLSNQSGRNIEEVIVHTGQHYDANMSDVFFDEMHIPRPDYHLGVGGKSHGAMTGQMTEKIEQVLLKEQPEWLLVYGDTNSTLAGAIAASKLNIKIAHIEAGLRSFNMQMPEEVNRILTDRISTLLFCPTPAAMRNLENEGIANWQTTARAILTGDVMKDGALFYRHLATRPENENIDNDFVLCTIHRAENTDNPVRLASVVLALNELGKDKQVVLPVHPRTKKILQMANYDTSNLTVIEPVGYLNMIWLIDNCSLVMTDSGGLQKEAFFFGKPCITLRDETEWVELIELGVNILTGADKESIVTAFEKSLSLDMSGVKSDMYGNGHASETIVSELLNFG